MDHQLFPHAPGAFAVFVFEAEPFGPARIVSSVAYGLQGTWTVNGSGSPGSEGRPDHTCLAVQLLPRPLSVSPLHGPSGWHTVEACVRLWPPGEKQHLAWRSPQTIFVFIAQERIEQLLERPHSQLSLEAWRGLDERNEFVSMVIAALSNDIAKGCPAGPIVGESLTMALAAHLASSLREVPAVEGRSLPSPPAFSRVLEYIDANLARPLRMAQLAREADCSQRQLSRAFRERWGMLPRRYVLARRVEKARSLIEMGQLTLAQVARAVGFADQSQMTKSFHRLVGTTPGRLHKRPTRSLR